MNEVGQYDFCPQCGALARDGVCQSCGHQIAGYRPDENAAVNTAHPVENQPVQENVPSQNLQQQSNGQPQYNGQAQYNGQTQYNGQSQYNGQPQYNGQSQYNGQPQYNGQAQYNGQPYNTSQQYYNGQQYSPYQQPKNNNHKMWIGIAIGAVVFLMLALFIVVVMIFSAVATEINKETKNWQEDYFYDYDYDSDYDYSYDYGDDYDYDYDDDYNFDFFDDFGYGNYDDYGWDDEYEDFESEYYEFSNEIRDDLSYSVEIEYDDSLSGDSEEEDYYVSYGTVVIDGIPNADEVNKALADEVLRAKQSYTEAYLEQEYTYFYSIVDPYVTYMDNDVCSVAYMVYEYYESEDDQKTGVNSWIASVNINVVNGTIIENTSMRAMDLEFAEEFREKSNIQNGSLEVDEMSAEEILQYLTDEQSLIIFYTPMGMEVGICFEGNDGTGSWVTVTYKEQL